MVPDNFLSGWEGDLCERFFLAFWLEERGGIWTLPPLQTTDPWLHEVGPNVTCYVCKVPDDIHEAFLD